MRAFGIVMALFGCAVAFGGFLIIAGVKDASGVNCVADTSNQLAPRTNCYYGLSNGTGTDPNSALRTAAGGLAVAVVGAGFVAGGLACAGAAGRSKPAPAPGYAAGGWPAPGTPPHPGGDAAFGAPGQPSPPPYGQHR